MNEILFDFFGIKIINLIFDGTIHMTRLFDHDKPIFNQAIPAMKKEIFIVQRKQKFVTGFRGYCCGRILFHFFNFMRYKIINGSKLSSD